jgi:DNA-binding NtrC family response regulator
MPDGEGLDLLEKVHETDPVLPVVVLTAFATVELAVDAMRRGAFDFITKPFVPAQVRSVVARATERVELLRENARLRREVGNQATAEMVGASAALAEVRDLVERVGPTDATVLITGETGTGKELVARALHAASPRRKRPFVAVNCAAFAETLLDSELFGHEKGAFTGAEHSRPGVFEAAHRGTLFLDEAGEMPLALQAKLLRVLMDGSVVRVGSTEPRTVDVRIVVATHRDLEQRVQGGAFRQDLYYRLAVVPIHVPPLRERPEDVPLLVEHFLRQVATELKVRPRTVAPEALARLMRYPLPGNARELRNLVERATILARGDTIEIADLPDLRRAGEGDDAGEPGFDPEQDPVRRLVAALPERVDLRDLLERIERRLLEQVLAEAGGVQAEAARRLGISRSDMSYKVRRLGLLDDRLLDGDPPDGEAPEGDGV